MRPLRPLHLCAAAILAAAIASPALARNPPNPYAGFNLSGVNYGSMQWERDQRAGKVVWPYFNIPQRRATGPTVSAGGAGPTTGRAGGSRGWRRGRR